MFDSNPDQDQREACSKDQEVVEIVGIDPNSLEVITNEVFRWDVSDDFIFSGKSYVLEKIMVKINYSQEEMRELRTRKRVLEWMVLNDIRKADQVSQIVTEYYVRPRRSSLGSTDSGEVERMAPPFGSSSQPLARADAEEAGPC